MTKAEDAVGDTVKFPHTELAKVARCQEDTEVSAVYNTLLYASVRVFLWMWDSKPRFPGKSQASADTKGRVINLKHYHRGSGREFID